MGGKWQEGTDHLDLLHRTVCQLSVNGRKVVGDKKHVFRVIDEISGETDYAGDGRGCCGDKKTCAVFTARNTQR